MGMVLDTLNLDNHDAKDHDVHHRWLGEGRWGVEDMNQRDAVPPKGAAIVVERPRIKGAKESSDRIMSRLARIAKSR